MFGLLGLGLAAAIVVVSVGLLLVRKESGKATYEVGLAVSVPEAVSRVPADIARCPDTAKTEAKSVKPAMRAGSYIKGTSHAQDLLIAPGQVVAFQLELTASAKAPNDGSLEIQGSWPRSTARRPGFDGTGAQGESPFLCVFLDGSDPAKSGDASGEPATVTYKDIPATADKARVSLKIEGIDPGERLVVGLWLRAPSGLPTDIAELATTLDAAAASGGNVRIANRSVSYRLLFFDSTETPDVQLTVTDDAKGALPGEIGYRIGITNTSRRAVAPAARLDAFIDPSLRLLNVDPSDGEGAQTKCTTSATGFSCAYGFLNPGETVLVTATAAVAPGAMRRFTRAEGSCDGGDVDLCIQTIASWKKTAVEDGQVRFDKPTDLPSETKLSLAKLVPKASYAYNGAPATFTYSAVNATAGSLGAVRVVDSGCPDVRRSTGDANGNTRLDQGETWTFTCTVARLEAAAATSESRIDTVDERGVPVTAAVTTRIELIAPKLTVSVAAGSSTAGDGRARRIVVTNAGTGPIDDIAVLATGCSGVLRLASETASRLAPGERSTFLCAVDNAAATTSARAYGVDPLGGPVTAVSNA